MFLNAIVQKGIETSFSICTEWLGKMESRTVQELGFCALKLCKYSLSTHLPPTTHPVLGLSCNGLVYEIGIITKLSKNLGFAPHPGVLRLGLSHPNFFQLFKGESGSLVTTLLALSFTTKSLVQSPRGLRSGGELGNA